MIEQGDIIRLNFSPAVGHEQAGERPALVVSRPSYNKYTDRIVACPITSSARPFAFQLELDYRTKTRGFIMCEQMKMLDIESRGYGFIEKAPKDITENACKVCQGILEFQFAA